MCPAAACSRSAPLPRSCSPCLISCARAPPSSDWRSENRWGCGCAAPEADRLVEDEVLDQAQGVLLSIAIALAFWSVARGARVLTKTLNVAFEAEETRPAWKRIMGLEYRSVCNTNPRLRVVLRTGPTPIA